jgi:hypothetical protein
MKKYIQNFLNKYGYYKISQLNIGGTCGCCGELMPSYVYYDYYWTSKYGVCEKCLEEGDTILQIYGTNTETMDILTKKNMEKFMTTMGDAMLNQ